jgi:hypothetical protein
MILCGAPRASRRGFCTIGHQNRTVEMIGMHERDESGPGSAGPKEQRHRVGCVHASNGLRLSIGLGCREACTSTTFCMSGSSEAFLRRRRRGQ